MNEQLSEKDYRNKVADIAWDDYLAVKHLKEEFMQLVRSQPQAELRGFENSGCSGDFLQHSVQAENCFDCSEIRDCLNCYGVKGANDCLDLYSWGAQSELIYGSSRIGYSSKNIICSHLVFSGCENIEYSSNCHSSKDCFGCVGLKSKQYCILNKQYSKAEYFSLRERIVRQMNTNGEQQAYGTPLPYKLSHHPYNFSDAMLYFPLSKSEALRRGASWHEEEETNTKASRSWETLPGKTSEISDDILQESFSCETSAKIYRITKRELQAYRARNIPVPREHWRERLLKRIALLNPPRLHERVCPRTSRKITSSFPNTENWIVWERETYLTEFRS